MKRLIHGVLIVLLGCAALISSLPSARAVDIPAGRLVSTNPADFTPHVLDGRVLSVIQVGDTIILGGTFTQARNSSSQVVINRSRLMAFNATTGVISSFAPNPNGTVNVVIPAGDGQSIYVGGSFTSIAGQTARNLARIRVSDGSLMSTFNGGSPTGQVRDLRLINGRLWVAGSFTHITGRAQPGLATINANTGAFDTYFSGVVGGNHNNGVTQVLKIDANPAGTKLVAIGNFETLNTVVNNQLFMLDLGTTSASPANFRTSFYFPPCASGAFDSYMRDIDFAPSGSFFVVSTTGAYGGSTGPCDTTARFDLSKTGTNIQPSWVNYTGGDTTYGVEVTSSAVYVGGHQRWQNNPFAGDQPGAGAVSREGIAALSPDSGIPFSWNPGRTKGVGVFDFLSTSQGLWVVSDTDRIGNFEFHARVALMPAAGQTFPAVNVPTLPNDVYLAGPSLTKRTFNGSSAGLPVSVPEGGINWDNVRGAFMINGYLYLAFSDGSFNRRTFNGATYGTPQPVNGQDALVVLQTWRSNAALATSMFYDFGRIYYTRGTDTLFYRYFNPESGIVGAKELVASDNVTGIDLSEVRGMFTSGGRIYFASTDGSLRRMTWNTDDPETGRPVSGTAETVSGPSWSRRALFLYQGADGGPAPQQPTANFQETCSSLTCDFDGSSSSAPGSTITSHAWDFGDGLTGSGVAPSHTYASSGTYNVQLTVTSAAGGVHTAGHQITVTQQNQPPTASFTVSCEQLDCDFDGTESSDPEGPIADFEWDFDGEGTATGPTATHTFEAAGTKEVTLTVSDGAGTERSVTETFTVSADPADTVDFVAAASTNGNRTTHAVTVPTNVQAGDRLLLFLTTNVSTAAISGPPGWTPLEALDANGLLSQAWTKIATGSDDGSVVSATTSGLAKSDITVAAYRGSAGTPSVHSFDARTVASTTAVTSPVVDADAEGAVLVSYWGIKSSDTINLSIPGSEQVRSASAGTGSGRVGGWLADSGESVTGDQAGGLQATTAAAVSRAAIYSVAVSAD